MGEWWVERIAEVERENRALGERCHQLENALTEIRDYPWSDPNVNVLRHIARAALGDTPPPETEEQYDERTGAFYEDDEDPAKVRAAFNVGEKGYTTGTRSITHDLRGDTAVSPETDVVRVSGYQSVERQWHDAAVEPPQPETAP